MYMNLKFLKMVREEKLRPMVHKGHPWAMDQFKRVYCSVRVPGDPMDNLVSPFKTGERLLILWCLDGVNRRV